MKQLTLITLAALLVGTIVYLMDLGGHDETPAAPPGSGAGVDEPVHDVPDETPATTTTRQVVDAAAKATSADPQPATEGTLPIEVVDPATGAPVPGARGYQMRSTDYGWSFSVVESVVEGGVEVLRQPLAEAARLEADEMGVLRAHDWTEAWVLLVLEPGAELVDGLPTAGARRGFAFSGSERRAELALARSLTVTVRDPAGHPVSGATVINFDPITGRDGGRALTDEHGRWILHEVNTLISSRARHWGRVLGRTPNLSFGLITTPEGERVDVDPAEPHDVELELVGATLILLVRDAEGKPFQPAAPVLHVQESASNVNLYWKAHIDEQGRAIVPDVPIGVELAVEHQEPGAVRELFDEVLVEPLPPEGATVTLRAKPLDDVDVRIHLIDAEGNPIADRSVLLSGFFRAQEYDRNTSFRELRTDADGVVRFDMQTRPKELMDGDELDFEILLEPTGGDFAAARPYALVGPLVGPTGPPWVFEGVVLRPLKPLVTGRVVSASGEPVTDASIFVDRTVQGRNSFVHGMGQRVHRDDEGNFAIYSGEADTRSAEWTVWASGGGHGRTGPVAFRPGARDVEVAFPADTQLEVTFAKEHAALARGLTLRLQPMDPAARKTFRPTGLSTGVVRGRWVSTTVGASGRVRWRSVGSKTLRAELLLDDEVLERWDDIVLEPGTVVRDPRLQDLRLDRWFDLVPFRVVGRSGFDVRAASVTGMDGGMLSWSEGTMVLRDGPIKVLVEAQGFLGQVVEVGVGGALVELTPTVTVSLRLPSELDASHGARVSLSWEVGGFTSTSRDSELLAGSLVEVDVMGTGTHTVNVSLPEPGKGSKRFRMFELPTKLELGPASDGQLFDVAPSWGLLEALDD